MDNFDTTIVVNAYDKYRSTVITSLITAVLLLVTLAWNDVVQEIIAMYYPKETRQSIQGKFIYAIMITIIVLLVQTHVFYLLTETNQTKE
jgi:heme/copper-type cytochrome/quinol oxidase subunit 2